MNPAHINCHSSSCCASQVSKSLYRRHVRVGMMSLDLLVTLVLSLASLWPWRQMVVPLEQRDLIGIRTTFCWAYLCLWSLLHADVNVRRSNLKVLPCGSLQESPSAQLVAKKQVMPLSSLIYIDTYAQQFHLAKWYTVGLRTPVSRGGGGVL